MHYFIDGYNLLFRIVHAGENLKTQRDQLIQDLVCKVNLLQLDVTLVFDSQYQNDEGSRSHNQHLEIIYTAVNETADDFILQELKEASKPSQHTVVTSDKKLAWLCRRRLANTESVDVFFAWLNKRCKNKLRLRKEKKNGLSTLIPPISPPKPKPEPEIQVPLTTSSAEECFDFYLTEFEKETQKFESERVAAKLEAKAKKPPAKPMKSKAKPQQPKDQHLSNMQRWLQAFEGKENGQWT